MGTLHSICMILSLRQSEVLSLNLSPAIRSQRAKRTFGAKDGGEGGIRTPGTVPGSVVFKTTAIDHSATSPYWGILTEESLRHKQLRLLLILRQMLRMATLASEASERSER
jgi:hypothetical protein